MELRYIISSDWLFYEKNGELFIISSDSDYAFKMRNMKKKFFLSFKDATNKEDAFKQLEKDQIEFDKEVLNLMFDELVRLEVLVKV